MISSTLMIILPQQAIALLFVRLLAGIGHGLVFISAILHCAENTVNRMRADVVAWFPIAITLGILISPLFFSTSLRGWNENRYIGIFNLLLSVIGTGIVPYLTCESVVSSFQKGEDATAINNMSRLRREPTNNEQLTYDAQEIKEMIREDEQQSRSPFTEGNAKALICVVLMRVLYVISFNYAFNMGRVKAMLYLLYGLAFTPIPGLILRLFIATIASMFIEKMGRKNLLLISSATSSANLVALAIYAILIPYLWNVVHGVMFITVDGLIGLGVTFLPDVFMSEAFPTRKKLPSAIVACIVEYVLQIIFIVSLYTLNIPDFNQEVLVVFAVLFCVITATLFFLLPNIARNSTLRQARAAFQPPRPHQTIGLNVLP